MRCVIFGGRPSTCLLKRLLKLKWVTVMGNTSVTAQLKDPVNVRCVILEGRCTGGLLKEGPSVRWVMLLVKGTLSKQGSAEALS